MKYHLISLGCPKNTVDSERMAWVMKQAGWLYSSDIQNSDLIILNTCAFIAPATEESLDYLSELIEWKSEAPPGKRKIVLTGCLPGRYKDDGSGGLEEIDLVTGPGEWRKLSAWLGRKLENEPSLLGSGTYRYLKIANGCSNNCAYCTIPSIRGKFIGRTSDTILRESDVLVSQGAKEIGLVAQDSGNWNESNSDLTKLAETLARRHPSIWFRLYYLHPLHFPHKVIELFSKYSNIMPYIDMPIQHASSQILKRMGRKHDTHLLERILKQIEDSKETIAVRYTVITGYPGETDKDFEILKNFLGRYKSGRHIAAFSWFPEEGTIEYSRAKEKGDAINESIAATRLAELSSIGDSLYADWNEMLLNKTIRVLSQNTSEGHTIWDAPEVDAVVSFTEPVKPGEVIRAKVLESSGAEIVAKPIY